MVNRLIFNHKNKDEHITAKDSPRENTYACSVQPLY